MTQEEDDDQDQKLINEGNQIERSGSHFLDVFTDCFAEYKTWKKNSPFLYDMILG